MNTRSRKRPLANMLFFVFMLGAVFFVPGAEVCEFSITQCPEDYNGDTIHVPQNVIALSSRIKACPITGAITDDQGSASPFSLLFVIDHSGSMTGTGRGANDVYGSRFTVTKALLDTIYKLQPAAEVGLIVFREHLFFDARGNQYFAHYFSRLPTTYDNEPNQAYLSYLKLNGSYDGKLGVDILKDVLETDTISYGQESYVDLKYQPAFRNEPATNINIAFKAVQDALLEASNPADRQFAIFMSDGEPMGASQAGERTNYFQQGHGMPATFTIYFTPDQTAPQSIVTMTQNIRTNGYSSANPKSDYWAIKTNHDDLMQLIMENVLSAIIASGSPNRMIVNGMHNSDTLDAGEFLFSNRFALQDGMTEFNIAISFRLIDSASGQYQDSTMAMRFAVMRTNDHEMSPGIELNCWEDTLPPADDPDDPDTSDTPDDPNDPDTSDTPGDPNDPDSIDTPDDPGAPDSTGTPEVKQEEIRLSAGPNPFTPGKTLIPQTVRAFYRNVVKDNVSGTIIGVTTKHPLKPTGDDSYGTASIYDAVGNLIVSKLPVRKANADTDYGVYWNGANSNKRIVGGGAYLARVEITDINGKKELLKYKIGIKY